MNTNTARPASASKAALDELLGADGPAELIGGRAVPRAPAGTLADRAAASIVQSLGERSGANGQGAAFQGAMNFLVPELPSGRESFSPNASYYEGPLPANGMRFIEGPPTFAVEVRGAGERGPGAVARFAWKCADYFEAGTLVVWDVDPVARRVRKYRASAPDEPIEFQSGDVADAEPAVPGWRMPVDRMFD